MIDLQINIGNLQQEFSLGDRQVDNMLGFVVEEVAAGFARNWYTEANVLVKSREEYQRSIQVESIDQFTKAVYLTPDAFLPNAVETGVETWDMKCIVNPLTKIYTSKGYKFIKDIKIDDLVLTHKGKFQRVVDVMKVTNEDDFVIKIFAVFSKKDKRTITPLIVTKTHPILTKRGWVKAEDLLQSDNLIVLAKPCKFCNKLIPTLNIDEDTHCNKTCSALSSNSFRKKHGRIDLSEDAKKRIGAARSATNKRMYTEGKHVSQRIDFKELIGNGFSDFSTEKMADNIQKAFKSLGKNSFGYSEPEQKLWEFIKDIDGIKRQYLFKRNSFYTRGRVTNEFIQRCYYFDFAIPEYKICIEVNGEQFHTEEQNANKRDEVESHGWRYISFWSQEIYKDLDNCVKEIHRVLDNHEGNYEFIETGFTMEKVYPKRYSTTYNYKYNLTVEDDSSYIANGIVTHNSGFFNSPKAKTGKDGKKWLTIPFRIGTPDIQGDNPLFAAVMPKEIHNLVLQNEQDNPVQQESSGLPFSKIPSEYQMPQSSMYRKALKSDAFAKIEEGTAMTSLYSGLKRNAKGSGYVIFRRVSENSEADKFIHPGIMARNLGQKAKDSMDIPFTVDVAVDTFLYSLKA